MSDQRWLDGLLEAGFDAAQTAALLGWPDRVARMVKVEAAPARCWHVSA